MKTNLSDYYNLPVNTFLGSFVATPREEAK